MAVLGSMRQLLSRPFQQHQAGRLPSATGMKDDWLAANELDVKISTIPRQVIGLDDLKGPLQPQQF